MAIKTHDPGLLPEHLGIGSNQPFDHKPRSGLPHEPMQAVAGETGGSDPDTQGKPLSQVNGGFVEKFRGI